jgi:hypothetical protein
MRKSKFLGRLLFFCFSVEGRYLYFTNSNDGMLVEPEGVLNNIDSRSATISYRFSLIFSRPINRLKGKAQPSTKAMTESVECNI